MATTASLAGRDVEELARNAGRCLGDVFTFRDGIPRNPCLSHEEQEAMERISKLKLHDVVQQLLRRAIEAGEITKNDLTR